MNKVNDWIQKYIGADEVLMSWKGPTNDTKKWKDPSYLKDPKGHKDKKERGKETPKTLQLQIKEVMPLIASLSEVYWVIANDDYLQKLSRMMFPGTGWVTNTTNTTETTGIIPISAIGCGTK